MNRYGKITQERKDKTLISLPQVKDATNKIKELADVRTQSMEDVDTVLRVYHTGITSGEFSIGESDKLDKLLKKHRQSSLPRAV